MSGFSSISSFSDESLRKLDVLMVDFARGVILRKFGAKLRLWAGPRSPQQWLWEMCLSCRDMMQWNPVQSVKILGAVDYAGAIFRVATHIALERSRFRSWAVVSLVGPL